MTDTPTPAPGDAVEATSDEQALAAFGLPIEHLFMIDPMDLTSDDLLLLVTHYRNQRFNHLKAMNEKPARVEKNRNPKLDKEASKAEADAILKKLFGDE